MFFGSTLVQMPAEDLQKGMTPEQRPVVEQPEGSVKADRETEPIQDAGLSSARFSFSTLTRGSPRRPNWRLSVCLATNPLT